MFDLIGKHEERYVHAMSKKNNLCCLSITTQPTTYAFCEVVAYFRNGSQFKEMLRSIKRGLKRIVCHTCLLSVSTYLYKNFICPVILHGSATFSEFSAPKCTHNLNINREFQSTMLNSFTGSHIEKIIELLNISKLEPICFCNMNSYEAWYLIYPELKSDRNFPEKISDIIQDLQIETEYTSSSKKPTTFPIKAKKQSMARTLTSNIKAIEYSSLSRKQSLTSPIKAIEYPSSSRKQSTARTLTYPTKAKKQSMSRSPSKAKNRSIARFPIKARKQSMAGTLTTIPTSIVSAAADAAAALAARYYTVDKYCSQNNLKLNIDGFDDLLNSTLEFQRTAAKEEEFDKNSKRKHEAHKAYNKLTKKVSFRFVYLSFGSSLYCFIYVFLFRPRLLRKLEPIILVRM